jgi:hypothetical protein
MTEIAEIEGRLATLEGLFNLLRMEIEGREDQFLEVLPHIVPSAPAAEAEEGYAAPFDMGDVGTDAFTILDNKGKTNGCWVAGLMKTVADGTGMTYDTDHWNSGTISADTYVYLELDRSAATATIKAGSGLSDGTDTVEVFGLWYLPWSTDHIDEANIVDLRAGYHLPGMA